MEENPQKPRRFQFSLRTVLIVMAVLAVPLGWWSWKVERQRRAVENLENRGAYVSYNGDWLTTGDEAPRLLHWRYRVFAVRFFQSPTDADILDLQALDGLETVDFTTDSTATEARLLRALPNCKVRAIWQ